MGREAVKTILHKQVTCVKGLDTIRRMTYGEGSD